MPELPEVETLRRQLEAAVPGRRIVGCWLSADPPRLLRNLTDAAFAEAIQGRMIQAIRRRGKWLILDLDADLALVAHLRMTGRILLRRPEDAADPYLRARLSLDDGTELRWSDVRKFGTWDLVHDPDEITGSMGPEPLSASFSAADLIAAAEGRRTPIKSLLLDQHRVAGLGNIYVDEALWYAQIHPRRSADSITPEEAERLHRAIVEVLTESLESGGSSMRDYLDTAGRAGRFQERWRVYKREGTSCRRCATPVARITVGGRGTRFCPHCQSEPETGRTPAADARARPCPEPDVIR